MAPSKPKKNSQVNSSAVAISSDDEASTASSPSQPSPKGKAKPGPAKLATFHGLYTFTTDHDYASDKAIFAQFSSPKLPVWNDGATPLPIPESVDTTWCAHPPGKDTKYTEPGAAKNLSGTALQEKLFEAHQNDPLAIKGSMCLHTWNKGSLNANFVVPYLSFKSNRALQSWCLCEGKSSFGPSYPSWIKTVQISHLISIGLRRPVFEIISSLTLSQLE